MTNFPPIFSEEELQELDNPEETSDANFQHEDLGPIFTEEELEELEGPYEDSRTRLMEWLERRNERQGNNEGNNDNGEGEATRNNPVPTNNNNNNNDTNSTPSDSDTEEEESDDHYFSDNEENEMESPWPKNVAQESELITPVVTPQFDYNFSTTTPTTDPEFPAAINSILKKGFVLKPLSKPYGTPVITPKDSTKFREKLKP